MKLLSTTPLAQSLVPVCRDGVPYRSIANKSYIAVRNADSTVHVLSSISGLPVLKQPYAHLGEKWVGGLVFDGEGLAMTSEDSVSLTILNIPTE